MAAKFFLSVAFISIRIERRLYAHHPRVLDKKMLSAILIIFHIIELCMCAMSGRFSLFIYRRSEFMVRLRCPRSSSTFHLIRYIHDAVANILLKGNLNYFFFKR